MKTSDERSRLTEPLESVTAFFGGLMILAALAGVALLVFGSGSFRGLPSSVCVTRPGARYGASDWNVPFVAARQGNSVSVIGALQACADHATVGEQALSIVAGLSAVVFWGGLLFLLWRMIVIARQHGPFTQRVAAALWRLGRFIIIGAATAAVVRLIAIDALLTMMTSVDQPFANLLAVPLQMPVPLLAGAALLTFARIIRVGAAMDAEIQGTI